MNTGSIQVLTDPQSVARAAVDLFIDVAARSMAKKGLFNVVLSGGSSPNDMFDLLATRPYSRKVNWDRVFVFWGDERCVPPDHPESNFGSAYQRLLSKVPIPERSLFRIRGEIAPDNAADEYETQIRVHFAKNKSSSFDLIFLGLGTDGHTASLFPGSPAINERIRFTTAIYKRDANAWRVTLTPAALRLGEKIVFLVTGVSKAEILPKIFKEPLTPEILPAQVVFQTDSKITWLVDRNAAKNL